MEKIEIWLDDGQIKFRLLGNTEVLLQMLDVCKDWILDAEEKRKSSPLKWGEIGEA